MIAGHAGSDREMFVSVTELSPEPTLIELPVITHRHIWLVSVPLEKTEITFSTACSIPGR